MNWKPLCPLCHEEEFSTTGLRRHLSTDHNLTFDDDKEMIRRLNVVGLDVEVKYEDGRKRLLFQVLLE